MLDLTTICKYAENLGFGLNFGHVINPGYFNLNNIPISKRQNIINYLNSSPYKEVQRIANIFDSTYNNLNRIFWDRVNEIDKRRNQNFNITYPEMSEIMKLD